MVSPRLLRIAYLAAALVVAVALATHVSTAMRTGQANWPPLLMMTGLLILMVTGAVEVQQGKGRNLLTLTALALVIPGALMVFATNH